MNPPLYEHEIQNIIQENEISALPSHYKIVSTMPKDFVFTDHKDWISFETRTKISAGGGLVLGTGVSALAAKIASKAATKNTAKLAAKAVAKAAASKAASAGGVGAGAASGAAVGSAVFPGPGTVAGAVAGAIITGVAIDAAILSIEEQISKENYKLEILEAIQEERQTFQSTFGI